MLVTLLRHGETQGRPSVFRGRSDPALSHRGWIQLEKAARVFNAPKIDRLFTSPSRRCYDFAARWSELRNLACLRVEDLREMDFGEWEELTPAEASSRDADCYATLQRDPENWCSPNGESYRLFRERVLRVFTRIASEGGEHIGVLTHGGVIRVILSEVLAIPAQHVQRIAVDYATSCRLWYSNMQNTRLLSLTSEP